MATVSLYIPVFNGMRYIEQCVKHIVALEYPLCQIIIVDDGSTDGLHDWVEHQNSTELKYIHLERRSGIGAARNAACAAASGDFIAAVDVDCLVPPDWLGRLMPHFHDAAIVGVGAQLREQETTRVVDRWRTINMDQTPHLRDGRPVFLPGCNTVFRRRALEEIGGYNDACYYHHEDTDLCARLSAAGGHFSFVSDVSVVHAKKDSVRSVMRSCWGFRHAQPVLTGRGCVWECAKDIVRSGVLFFRDVCAGRFSLCGLDLVYGIYQVAFSLYSFTRQCTDFK